jgi:hypothetical protein
VAGPLQEARTIMAAAATQQTFGHMF